jgi:hypothetical protein
MKTQAQIHPRINELHAECENLSEGLAGLIVERDHLKNQVLPMIDIEYTTKFGEIIKCLLTLEYESGAMKRRIELVQANLNRGETVAPNLIESQIETEFHAFLSKINEQEIKNRQAEFVSNSGFLSVADSREIQTIYRKSAKKLHPDFVGNDSKQHHEIWLQVAAAYQNTDLQTLRSLDLVIDSLLQNEATLQTENSIEVLENRQEKLLAQTKLILNEISKIRKSEKFELAEKLEDEIWCDEQREIFQTKIFGETENLKRLTEIFQHLLSTIQPENNNSEDDWAEIII